MVKNKEEYENIAKDACQELLVKNGTPLTKENVEEL